MAAFTDQRRVRRYTAQFAVEVKIGKKVYPTQSVELSERALMAKPIAGLLTSTAGHPAAPTLCSAIVSIPENNREFDIPSATAELTPSSHLLLKYSLLEKESEPLVAAARHAAYDHMIGQHISHYRVDRAIQVSSRSGTYVAKDLALNREVVLKVLRPGYWNDDASRARLLREARLAAQINHPNTVHIHEVDEDDGLLFIAMQFIKGSPLSSFIEQNVITIDGAIRIGIAVCDGLSAAHDIGVIHRDLKPDNIIVDDSEHVTIVDFGLARYQPPIGDPQATSTRKTLSPEPFTRGTIIGTPGYLSPEQARGDDATARSDFFSLGAVLYEIVTGSQAFPGSGLEVLNAILHKKSIAIDILKPDIPQILATVIGTCLAKDPNARFGTAAEVASQLRRLEAHGPMVQPRFRDIRAALFKGLCFVCNASTDRFQVHPSERLCENRSCARSDWPSREHQSLVTTMPEWRTQLDLTGLPALRSKAPFDLLARWADHKEDFPREFPGVLGDGDPSVLAQYLPYSTDSLRIKYGLHCGNPIVYRSKRLQVWLDHDEVYVLDFSTCVWSHTMKDPKSWAVLNVALETGIRHLAAWTAGNAGYSLASLARACNHHLRIDKKLRVYALADQSESIDDDIMNTLSVWDCKLIPVPNITKKVVSPKRIKDKVNEVALRDHWSDNSYWEVSDGWDAVGNVMYRLIMNQVIAEIAPTHIIGPLGTGNLMVGLFKALDDLKLLGVTREWPKVTAAIPMGPNIVRQIEKRKVHSQPNSKQEEKDTPDNVPVMPKIDVTYTPLMACIDKLISSERMRCIEVSAKDQSVASERLGGRYLGRRIVSEPSAVAPFAALPQLGDLDGRERLLVINSGFGLLSQNERKWVHEHLRR